MFKWSQSACLNLPIQTHTTTALKHIGMAPESGSIDFSDLLPEFIAADWYPVSTLSVLQSFFALKHRTRV